MIAIIKQRTSLGMVQRDMILLIMFSDFKKRKIDLLRDLLYKKLQCKHKKVL
jgi:hypothetical protein